MDQSAPNQFRAALTYLLDKEGRGAQTRLADEQNIDRGYLNAIVRGRKSGSEKKRSEIAAHFGMMYEDMLSLGRRILKGEDNPSLEKDDGDGLGGTENVGASGHEKKLSDFGITPKHGAGSENIPGRIVSVIEVLESDTGYSDLLAGLIDAFQDTVSTKKRNQELEEKIRELENENLEVKNRMQELESRISTLESTSDRETESLRKTA